MTKPRTASSIGRRNRQRGQEGERELCALLTDALGVKVQRALGQERDRGTDVLTLAPFAIEVKRRKRVANLYEWLAQALGPSPVQSVTVDKGLVTDIVLTQPIVALRADGKDWLVVMRLPDWIKLAREEISRA